MVLYTCRWLWTELYCACQKGSLFFIRFIQYFITFVLKQDRKYNPYHSILELIS